MLLMFFDDIGTNYLKSLLFDHYFYVDLIPNPVYQMAKKEILDTNNEKLYNNNPLMFLENLKKTFPKLVREKFDALKNVSEENLEIKDKAYEYNIYLEIAILDIIANMLTCLETLNCLFYKVI